MSNQRIAVAMSGGVDSSVAAAILKEKGLNVFGITMILAYREGHACLEQDVEDAAKVCQMLDIPHEVIRIDKPFKKNVVDYFVREYTSGRTPNPCAACNPRIKFGELLKQAQHLGASHIATGHYAIISKDKDSKHYILRKAKERGKDQSYFLSRLPQSILGQVLFPIGTFPKSKIRNLAEKIGLHVADKTESQEICFIPDENVPGFIENELGHTFSPGPILDIEGNVLGEHQGIIRYTIGQRKGLGIALGKPAYVIRIDADNNAIVIGDGEDLYHDTFTASDPNWIAIKDLQEPFKADIRIRHNHKPVPGVITPQKDGTLIVKFDKSQRAITPGQLSTFYRDDIVLGSAWIDKVL